MRRGRSCARACLCIFARIVVDAFAPLVDDVLHRRADAPAPIMPWVEWMTGGGRLVQPARIAEHDMLTPE